MEGKDATELIAKNRETLKAMGSGGGGGGGGWRKNQKTKFSSEIGIKFLKEMLAKSWNFTKILILY